MTSLIAVGGSGRSTSVIPALPAASSITTIAFMGIVSSLICLLGGTRTNAVCHLQAQLSTALLRGGVDLRPTGNVANPEGPHLDQRPAADQSERPALVLGQAVITSRPEHPLSADTRAHGPAAAPRRSEPWRSSRPEAASAEGLPSNSLAP